MIWHPLLIAVLVGDLLSLLLLLAAVKTAFQIIIKWVPHSAERKQIQLERKAETARLSAKFSIAVFLFSTAILIIGITNVMPQIVPGAMCGTGVLQSTDGLGSRALIYRFLAFFIMAIWLTLEKLNISRPNAPLTIYNSRVLLLSLPFFLPAVITTFRGILRIDSHQPVDCCAVVYDQFGHLATAQRTAGIPNTYWVWAFWMLTALLLVFAVWSLNSKEARWDQATGCLAIVTFLWVPIAAINLVKVYTSYYYEVLHHPCPWCLFLPEHKFAGVPLFGVLLIIAVEGPISFVAAKIAKNYSGLFSRAKIRSRIAGLRLLLAAVAFIGMVTLPAIYWRFLYGVWMR